MERIVILRLEPSNCIYNATFSSQTHLKPLDFKRCNVKMRSTYDNNSAVATNLKKKTKADESEKSEKKKNKISNAK